MKMQRSGRKYLLSLVATAAHFGVAQQTVIRWVDAGCPFRQRGDGSDKSPWQFEKGEVSDWLVNRRGEAGGSGAYEDARLRKLTAEAAIAEGEAGKLAETLVEVSAVEEAWVDAATRIRQRLLSIPPTIAPLLASAEKPVEKCHAILEEHIHEVLHELSQTRIDRGEGSGETADGSVADAVAPAEADRVPMGGPVPVPVARGKRGARKVEDVQGGIPPRADGRRVGKSKGRVHGRKPDGKDRVSE